MEEETTSFINIEWMDYFSNIGIMVKHINEIIINGSFGFDLIYGIPRGGLIPATILSYKFNIPLVLDLKEYKNERFLVIDDILDSGKTADGCIHVLKNRGVNPKNIAMCFLYSKITGMNNILVSSLREIRTVYIASKYVIPDNIWINFPYEQNCFVEDTISIVKVPGA